MILSLLILESILNIILLLFGAMLIFKARDNKMKFWWGITIIFTGIVLLHRNINWMIAYNTSQTLAFYNLLEISDMLKWLVLITCFSLFPLTSLRPGYLTQMRITILFIPIGATVLIAICYILFNGQITELINTTSIFDNLSNLDVRLRLIILSISVMVPVTYFYIPLWGNFSMMRRKADRTMTTYVLSLIFVIIYYIMFMVFRNDFILNTYGIAISILCLFFSILHLLYENPLSHHIQIIAVKEQSTSPKTLPNVLYTHMMNFFENNKSFTSPDYSIENLAHDLNTKQKLISDVIKQAGFTGFREFINLLRIEYFKKLAEEQRGKTIKELMYTSGFTSRSSFYRIFASYENTTPTEYIEKLYYQ